MTVRTNACANPSFETNTGSWSNANSATLVSSTDRAWTGTRSLKVVYSAAQAVNQSGAGLVNLTLTGLTAYTISAYVYVPSGSPHVQLQVHQAPSGVLATGSTTTAFDTWQRISLTFTTPASGSSLYFYLLNQSAASNGQMFYADAVLLEQSATLNPYFDGTSIRTGYYYGWSGTAHGSTSTETSGYPPRTNLSTNPSVETNTTGFTGATVTIARSTDFAWRGTASLKVTHSAVNTRTGAGVYHPLPVVAGKTYTFSVYAYVPTGQQPVVIQVQQSFQPVSSGTSTTVYDQWERLTVTHTAPVSGPGNFFVLNDTTSAVGKFFYIDGLLIEEAPTMGSYFDGSTVKDGYTHAWTGTANNSTSVQTPGALVTVKSRESGAWVGRVAAPKVRVSGAWVVKRPKRWNGTAWEDLP